MDILRGALGLFILLAFAYAFSANRKAINWKLVFTGIVLQFVFALSILHLSFVRVVFQWISERFVDILNFSKSGSEFLFAGLVTNTETFGFIFAFQVLPTIVFFSALSSFLYYLGVLQRVVFAFAWVMSKTMKLTGAESLSAAGNIFLGQTEAPLLVRPYLDKMSKSEIMTLMTGGMATIAGGVFAAYIGFLGGEDIEAQKSFAAHLLSASIMSAPAAIVAAKMLFPETEESGNDRKIIIPKDKIASNFLDSISVGTSEGLKLAVNVGAMLLTFTAFMYMFNYMFENWIGEWTGLNGVIVEYTDGRYSGLSLQYILGILFSPVAWILGVAAEDMVLIGQLLGEKTILNEFFAYATLGQLKEGGLIANQKSIIIATYALCGFANFASIGIQIGGIGALAPSQRKNLSELGVKALIGGTIACFMTATIAGMLSS